MMNDKLLAIRNDFKRLSLLIAIFSVIMGVEFIEAIQSMDILLIFVDLGCLFISVVLIDGCNKGVKDIDDHIKSVKGDKCNELRKDD